MPILSRNSSTTPFIEKKSTSPKAPSVNITLSSGSSFLSSEAIYTLANSYNLTFLLRLLKLVESDESIPLTGIVLMIEKSSPNGLDITTAFLYSESSASLSLSNTLGLSKEYVIACEKPVNCATSPATSSMLLSNVILPIVVEPLGSVVGILSYPKNLATSSAISASLFRSCLNVGIISSLFFSSYSTSSLVKYSSISLLETSVPRSALYLAGSKAILFLATGAGYTSTTPPTTSPAPSCSIKSHALFMASSASSGSSPFSNLPAASVLKPIFLADFLMLVPSNVAASKSIILTSSVIIEFSPPMIPAKPTALSPSHIRSASESSILSCPSSVTNFSPSSALLTIIFLPAIVS